MYDDELEGWKERVDLGSENEFLEVEQDDS